MIRRNLFLLIGNNLAFLFRSDAYLDVLNFLSGVFIINNKKIREFSCGKIQSKENLVVKKAKQREDSSIRMIKQREDSGEK